MTSSAAFAPIAGIKTAATINIQVAAIKPTPLWNAVPELCALPVRMPA
jgi:hypothetical protein